MMLSLKHDQVAATTERILNVLLPYRRVHHPDAPAHYRPQLEQIRRLVQVGDTIQFTLPAFPCKSPNPDKVLGTLPDMAERMSLRFLSQLCDQIGKFYSPGARILICSDGHVFSDLIRVNDEKVSSYTAGLINMIIEEQIPCIDLFQLSHVYTRTGFDAQRKLLIQDWARSLHELREEVLFSENQNQLYRGITRFLLDDSADHVGMSKTALQRHSRLRALAVMQRSEAWGNLIAQHHPRTVRLSIHPQPEHSAKLGIRLLNAPDNWTTPWHAVLVQRRHDAILMKHHEARQIADLVHVDGRPSHYVLTDANA